MHFLEAPKNNKHTVFVDNIKEVESFDPVKHFDTVPELMDRTHNRVRKRTLETQSFSMDLPKKQHDKIVKQRTQTYQEMRSRLQRANEINLMREELELERKLQSKGKKMKVKDASNGQPAIYRWKNERMK